MDSPYQFSQGAQHEIKNEFIPRQAIRYGKPPKTTPKSYVFEESKNDIAYCKSELDKIIGKIIISEKKPLTLNEFHFKKETGVFILFVNRNQKRIEKSIAETKYFLKYMEVTNSNRSMSPNKITKTPSIKELPEDAIHKNIQEFERLSKIENMTQDTELTSCENIAEKMRDIVLDSISKIQKDPAYIPQANAIAQQIQVLINIAKASKP